MDHYDSTDDERDAEDDGLDMDGEGGASAAVVARALGGRSSGIVLDDPYLAAAADSDEEDADGLGDMDSEDRDDYVLRPDDLLMLAARTEDDVSTLEVWVYEEASSSTGGAGWGTLDCGLCALAAFLRCRVCVRPLAPPVVPWPLPWSCCGVRH